MDKDTRFEKDVDISVKLFEMAKECEDAGMQVEDLFLSAIAAFFAMGEVGLDAALIVFGEKMVLLADTYVSIIKGIIKRNKDNKDN